ncbi:PDZ domain-containing protein [Bradyrhizobium icense]|uniref:PDZ domain-containing protein n=1 Tax=Bradyrhizobium icense TaxID=1274631 RepID=A0A1B1UDN3_9BRAD|nr:PDZ domain-containing protein [Bradyrhizobium icense]ANW00855.1 hypothetical protein LMTR13_12395 [Bradyrhizobium icense]
MTDVDPEGPAADHGLRTGDVILNLGGEAVNNAGDIRNALSDAKADAKHHVLMKIKTSGVTKFVAIPSVDTEVPACAFFGLRTRQAANL